MLSVEKYTSTGLLPYSWNPVSVGRAPKRRKTGDDDDDDEDVHARSVPCDPTRI